VANFLYLFWHKQAFQPTSPEEMERLAKAWWAWVEDLKKSGNFVRAGERMERTGKIVRGKAKVVSDGPYAEAKDTINGMMLMQAKDMDEAVELSKGCPIFESDGMVEVRPIISM
jgi:hypothetical protein